MTAYGMNYFFGANVKACKKCGDLKSPDAFPKVPKARDGRGGRCYACAYAAKAALVDDEKRAKSAARARKWKSLNQDKVKARRVVDRRRKGMVTIEEWRARLHERRAERDTARAVAKMDAAVLLDIRRSMIVGTWREHGLGPAESYVRRYAEDDWFRASELMRKRVNKVLRRSPYGDSPTIERELGYSAHELRQWLMGCLLDGMTWDKVMSGEIELDHIKPMSSFDVRTEQGMREAWALNNLQLLWMRDNRSKNAREVWDEKHRIDCGRESSS